MGISILGARKTRALARAIGEPVLRGWGGGHASLFAFTTPDHRHGEVDLRSGEVRWGGPDYRCPASCRWLFSGSCPRCDHPQHDPVGCTLRVDVGRGVCFHRRYADEPCPDPELHQREDQVTRPCRCAPDPEWEPPARPPSKAVAAFMVGLDVAADRGVEFVSRDEHGVVMVEGGAVRHDPLGGGPLRWAPGVDVAETPWPSSVGTLPGDEHPHWCRCQRVCGGDQ